MIAEGYKYVVRLLFNDKLFSKPGMIRCDGKDI